MRKITVKAPLDFVAGGGVKRLKPGIEYMVTDEEASGAFLSAFLASCEDVPSEAPAVAPTAAETPASAPRRRTRRAKNVSSEP